VNAGTRTFVVFWRQDLSRWLPHFPAAFYWIQAVLAWTIICGEIYRREAPFWLRAAVLRSYQRFGTADAALCAYFYLLFYSIGFSAPWILLKLSPLSRGLRAVLALWIGAGLLVFGEALYAFLRAVPTWLISLPWCFVGFCLLIVVAAETKRARALRRREVEKEG
jgi:hypothetical protein